MRDYDGAAIVLIVIIAIALIALAMFLGPLMFMWCWNFALCAIFPAIPTITFWQSFGLSILISLVGGSFGKRTYNFKRD